MTKAINRCRICGNTNLATVLDLGLHSLTGHFPKTIDQPLAAGPLQLMKCVEESAVSSCGLLQLGHSVDPVQMYGSNYGYRSGLNKSMVDHLHGTVEKLVGRLQIQPGDLVLDIGSNDATLLKAYPSRNLTVVGFDPVAHKYLDYYPDYIQLIPEFFSSEVFRRHFQQKKARLITSIAMFYDLEDPLFFMKQIHDILADDGLWCFEQSYMPKMIQMNAYDTVCHEHLEFFRVQQIKWMVDRAKLKIIDIELNDVNGGSFAVTVAKSNSSHVGNDDLVNDFVSTENSAGFSTLDPYINFSLNVKDHKLRFRQAIDTLKAENRVYGGYGASTKGNVILQYCEITAEDIPFIAEVNEEKFGCFTPRSNIPIISEAEARSMDPEILIVFPWHFRDTIVEKEKSFLSTGGSLMFPLPEVTFL